MTAPNDATATHFDPRIFDAGGQLLGRPTGVKCPACLSELTIGEIEGCQFAGCGDCGGMMFRQDVFGLLIQNLRKGSTDAPMIPKPLDSAALRVRRRCPVCTRMMETHAYGGPGNAVIDTCFPCHLIWLDQGELDKLIHAPGQR